MHQVLPETVNDSTSSLQAAMTDATVQFLAGAQRVLRTLERRLPGRGPLTGPPIREDRNWSSKDLPQYLMA
jgi:hypothetical protein